MSNRPVYLTPEGYAVLEQELNYLKTVRRQELANRLHEALGEGELIENAELEDARREQAFVEGRILALEEQLRKAIIIEEANKPRGVIGVGSHVTIQEQGYDTPEHYYVVGSAEADPAHGKISNESPLGKALLGKRAGDKAVVQAPDGDLVFNILAVD
ncbi:MAG TPA: transcription elongation factor GreA [Anaerolineae bacterium]|nr:transcription elongation factor GreA [Anaerolineae bacterium]